jgi:hypothetical protein
VDAALDAGIRAVVVTVNGYTAAQDFAGATLVLDSFGEPDASARRLAGLVPVAGFVGLDTLRAVHAAAWE